MEGWENKTLGDKLNSLQDLPTGYTPDLSSKWEIVEASLPANKKRTITLPFIRWSVAAAVLLAIGLVWVNADKKEIPRLAVKEQVLKPTTVFQQKQSSESELLTTNALLFHPPQPLHLTTNTNAKPARELAYQAPPSTTTIPVSEDTNRGGGWGNEENATKRLLPTVDSSSTKIAEQNTLATTAEEKPRPAKKKIYQRDFNDGVLVMDTAFAPVSRQHFSIQLKPFSRKTDADEPPARLLQLKQAL